MARFIHEQGLPCKIIVLTAAHAARSLAQQWGAAGYIAKPFALLRLLQVIEQAAPEVVPYERAA